MTTVYQKTVRKPAELTGIALHTGRRVRLTLRPAPPGNGICFRRLDLENTPAVQAHVRNVVSTQRGTTISSQQASVHTVEHVLAVLSAHGIDNAMIDMTGPEPPVGDGSAEPFVNMLRRAGISDQEAPREAITIERTFVYEDGPTKIVAVPADKLSICCAVRYHSTPLDCQYLELDITPEAFVNDLCRARTFCLYHEIEALMKANLICGGSLDNAVVIKGEAILSKEGLRYPDEFVRHKILDMVGDFALLGKPLHAQLIALKPGHPANVEMARQIDSATEGPEYG